MNKKNGLTNRDILMRLLDQQDTLHTRINKLFDQKADKTLVFKLITGLGTIFTIGLSVIIYIRP